MLGGGCQAAWLLALLQPINAQPNGETPTFSFASNMISSKMDLNKFVPPGIPQKSAAVAGLPSYKSVALSFKLKKKLDEKKIDIRVR